MANTSKYKKLKQYKCGECGNDKYELYQENGNEQMIISECTCCGSQTEITVKPTEITLGWGKRGDGIMAIF